MLFIDSVADGFASERIGYNGDGGKWICNGYKISKDEPWVVYGFGVGDDISFDEGMAKQFSCETHLFDPAPSVVNNYAELENNTPCGKGSLTFHPWGIGPITDNPSDRMTLVLEDTQCEVKTLDQIAQLLGHSTIDIIKMDIEGGEFMVFKDFFENSLLEKYNTKIVLVEFHLLDDHGLSDLSGIILELIKHDFILYRKEINPYSASSCAEFVFARNDFLLLPD
ncbi:MAG: FkbM family methyltransferase [Candidatus Aureabacteria bacterium]|nr:FkbM family methyltransferase [Candidatus Auribacterota bacterium]